jgi:putative ABC transport system permease protein
MLKNFIKIAIRNLLKRKAFTLINILGLATGMTICLLIVLFIRDELSFDNFQEKGDRIYRMVLDRKYPGRSTSYAVIPQSIGEAVQHEFPEVQESTRLFSLFFGNGDLNVKIGEKVFLEKNVLGADSNFFRVFSSVLLQGDAATVLQKANSVVLTESTAKRYFGSVAKAVGKTLETDAAKNVFVVTGVCTDQPGNSHFAFDILMSTAGFPQIKEPNYTGFSAYTYLLLRPGASPAAVEARFPVIIEKYVAGEIERGSGQSFKQFQAAGNGYHYYLQPLKKIHLISDLEAELRPNGSIKSVYIFGIIAIVILCLACINFINLSTARSVERAKEVGVRKTFGADRQSLIRQFLLESVMMSLLAVLIAFLLIYVTLPLLNKFSGKELTIAYFTAPLQILLLSAFAVVIGLLAGLYPALILSSFKPILVLKGKFNSNKYGIALRNGLVVFQFAISVTLIICTIIVNQQMGYMLGDKLGFKKDHIIVVERSDLLDRQTAAFKNELARMAGVENVSGGSSLPGQQNFFGMSVRKAGSKDFLTGRGVVVDDQYAAALDLPITEGRFFSSRYPTDSLGIILNEKAVRELGLKNPVGARLTSPDAFLNAPNGAPYFFTVVGVVKDFHFQSLHQQISPLIFINAAKFGNSPPFTAVRIKAGDFKTALASIGQSWKRFVPKRPFQYEFLDQSLADQYNSEQTTERLFTSFSVLAIFIACIGLLGLAAYATQQRRREIGVRKVLGASVGKIITMLSGNFMKLVLISMLLAFPVAWWAMHVWLQGFAYRVTISWWVFGLAAVITAGIAIATISFQAIRAAMANPVNSLRSE